MIETFSQWFEGKFNNKIQAFTYPSRYAYIVVQHKKITDNIFYGEQAYFNKTLTPYRQFFIHISEKDNSIIVKNYDHPNKISFRGFQKLNENFNENHLTYKEGCDTIFKWENNSYVGKIQEGCNCIVKQGNNDTYLENSAILGDGWYNVEDKGFDPITNKQVWGSTHGQFTFVK